MQSLGDSFNVRLYDVGGTLTALLVVDINNATGIDHVVRRIQNAMLQQQLTHLRGVQLIVGGTGDDAGSDITHRMLVDGSAHRAWCKHVDVGRQDFVDADDFGTQPCNSPVQVTFVDICHHQLSARFLEHLRQIKPHVTYALDCNPDSFEIRTIAMSYSLLDANKHAQGSERGRVSAEAVIGQHAGYETGFRSPMMAISATDVPESSAVT